MAAVSARPNSDPLALFHPAVARVVRGGVRGADAAADAGLAGDCARRIDAHPRADGQRQDAGGLPLVPRPPACSRRRRRQRGAAACCTSRRSRRWRSTSSATCARRWPASRRSPRARGDAFTAPAVAIRTGDTPANERARFQREPADILITTPESLYLLLTSNARERARARSTPSSSTRSTRWCPTKRGAHLALSLERLEELAATGRCSASGSRRRSGRSTKWRGSSGGVGRRGPPDGRDATRRASSAASPSAAERSTRRDPCTTSSRIRRSGAVAYRPVTIVDAGAAEGAAADDRGAGRGHGAARRDEPATPPSGPRARRRQRAPSIWSAIHPRLLELIRAHRSTLHLRQQPPPGRAPGGRDQRAGRRNARARRITDRSRARSASRSRTC